MSIPRTINIEPVLNGFIVTCGCQRLIFADKDALLREMRRYLEDPRRTEVEYRKDSVHREIMGGETEPCVAGTSANQIGGSCAQTTEPASPGRPRNQVVETRPFK